MGLRHFADQSGFHPFAEVPDRIVGVPLVHGLGNELRMLRRLGKHLEVQPGAEMMAAAACAEASGARLALVDRRIDLTLKRVWAALGFWQKTKLFGLLLSSLFSSGDEVSAEDVENLKQSDQLESAMGSAISLFEGASALVGPRFRFAPVKTTNDLLAVRSDLYRLGEDHQVTLHPQRFAPPPNIRLDPRYCKHIGDFELRFPNGAPSLLYCDSLTVEGDIRFGRDVRVEGDVHLRNPTDRPATIPDGIRLHTPIAR